MKNKQRKETASAVQESDLKALIKSHSTFFDSLIELIPARFYLPNDDDDSAPWFQGLSRTAKAAAKKQTRENLKKARRDRLNPEEKVSTLDRLNERNEKVDDDNDQDDDDEPQVERTAVTEDGERSVTYEELRQRLHHRIEMLRGNRGSDSTSRKRKQENQRQRDIKEGRKTEVVKPHEIEVAKAVEGIEFGKVKLVEGEDEKNNKRRKLSKGKMLEKAEELEEAKRDPEKGDEVAKKHSLKAALSRAAGVKVHDNAKLLKQSMHKDKKRQEKNAEKWKERYASRDKMKADKQQKRAGNISERIQQTKQRKIAKREKKLMRPGFEGRKEGYINK